MAVPVTTDGDFALGQPVPLFGTPLVNEFGERGSPYDVSQDGRRFLLSVSRPVTVSPPLNVVVNWATRVTSDKTPQ